MRRVLSLLLIALAWARAEPAGLVITHARLWTADGPQPDHEIVAHAGRITAVGPSGTLARPADARVVDARGDTLLPGLIDAHAHLVLGTRTPPDLAAETIAGVTARQLLGSGVTSARIHLWDLPGAVRMKRAAADDAFAAPRLVVGGPALFGGRPEWDSPTANVWGVKDIDDAVAKVARLHEAGVEWVALHDLARFRPGELEAIVAETRRRGLRILVGGDRFSEIDRGIALGAESLEYIDRSTEPYPPELLARLKSAAPAPFIVPLLGFPHRFRAYREKRLEFEERATEFFSPAAAAAIAAAWQEGQTGPVPHAPDWLDRLPAVAEKFRALRAAGLPVIVGTDCGSPAHFPADAIWWELETWRQIGVSVGEIVRAATEFPAQLLRQPDIGHLRPGARADFLLYQGDIADGPLAANRVRLVAKGGIVHREE